MRRGLLILAMALWGCGDDPSTGAGPAQGLCGEVGRADAYAVGLERAGDAGNVTVRFADASPAPPDRGDNAWVFEVLDASGQPAAPTSVQIRAWMPDHGHGTNPEWNDSAPMSGAGMFTVGPFDLFMNGFWEFTFEVTLADGRVDTTTFSFCLEG